MPTLTTYQVGSANNNLVRLEIDMDENLRIRKGRVFNDSDKPATIIIKKAGEVVVEQVVNPEDSPYERNLPASIKFLTRDYVPDDPDDEGTISMGDIEIGMRWG